MDKYLLNNYQIISSIVLWLVYFFLPPVVSILLSVFLILTIGLLHGANDLKLYFRKTASSAIQQVYFILAYLIALALIIGLYFLFPTIVLIIFIIISGYHFAQEHFEKLDLPAGLLKHMFLICYSLVLFSSLFYWHSDQVSMIIDMATGLESCAALFKYVFICSSSLVIILGILLFKKRSSHLLTQMMTLLGLVILFSQVSLLVGFATYFVFWHSIPSLSSQIQVIYGSIIFKNIKRYILDALPYFMVATASIILAALFIDWHNKFIPLYAIAFLAGITIPHMVVVFKMYSDKSH